MKITTVLAAFAVSSLFATGAFAQTMQPIPNPPETERPHHVTHHHVHHHVVHHVHHGAKTGEQTGGEQKGGAASSAPSAPPKGDQQPK